MQLAPDVTPEDLKVFLAEAEEHLQLLDQGFVRMEQGGEQSQALAEVFRAAHTLKGSSGMLGYAPMAEVAHAVENVLEKLRKGAIAMSPNVTDALLQSLDILRQLKEALVTGANPPEVAAVKSALERSVSSPAPAAGQASGAASLASLTLDAEARERLRAAIAAVKSPYQVQATVAGDCPSRRRACSRSFQN
jgi:two-component system chemotaxis sensor kinase CheA